MNANEKVDAIILDLLYGLSSRQIARKHGVSRDTVLAILHGAQFKAKTAKKKN